MRGVGFVGCEVDFAEESVGGGEGEVGLVLCLPAFFSTGADVLRGRTFAHGT